MIGRERAGKTAILKSLYAGPLRRLLPSGLRFGVTNPQEMAQIQEAAREDYPGMRKHGILSTVHADVLEYFLLEAGEKRCVFQVREAVGQVFSGTTPQSRPDQQAQYKECRKHLSQAAVLWQVIPCPPASATQHDLRRLWDDVLLTLTYAIDALKNRSVGHPAALALVVTKVDTRYESAEAARKRMPGEVLRWLADQVKDMLACPNLADVAAFPVTAYGFGAAELSPTAGPGREWVLKTVEPRPWNVTPLVVWSMYAGLRNSEVRANGDQEEVLERIARVLRQDLKSLPGCWYSPLKGE
jgi:hypothetical protein